MTSRKFTRSVETIFTKLPKSLKWQSFYRNDLNLLVETDKEVREVSIQNKLNRSQTSALGKLNKVSKDHFEALLQESPRPRSKEQGPDRLSPGKRKLSDFSAAEIDAITEKEMKKQTLAEQDISRETVTLISNVKVLLLSRLGIPIDTIASILKIDWKTAKKYSRNGALLKTIRNALDRGVTVPVVAKRHALPEPLVWAIALEGKNDRDRFDALGWKIRTWDYWYWNMCDQRFGDDWLARHRTRLTEKGGTSGERAQARRAGPPYFRKKSDDYDAKSISGLSIEAYLNFLESFFALAHQNTKKTTQMAFINADWRDFQSTPARNEMPDNAIMIDDYLHSIKKGGWQRTHIMLAPLSLRGVGSLPSGL